MDKMNQEQAIKDVCLIARNAIDRILELEHKRNKKWVGLTDEDMKDTRTHNFNFIDGARWAEEKLRSRNGG